LNVTRLIEVTKIGNGENKMMKKLIGSLLVVLILFSAVEKPALAASPKLNVMVVKGVAFFTVNGMKDTEVMYNFYHKVDGEYIYVGGIGGNSSEMGFTNIRRNGDYAIGYSKDSGEDRQVVEFKVSDSINDIKDPYSPGIVYRDYNIDENEAITFSSQTKNKYAIGINKPKYKGNVVYKMYKIEGNGKLKHLYTRKVNNSVDDVALFPRYKGSRTFLVTAEYGKEKLNMFFIYQNDFKYFENYFAGLK